MCLSLAWSLDDAVLVLGDARHDGLPVLGGPRRRRDRGARADHRMGPLDDPPRSAPSSPPCSIPLLVGWVLHPRRARAPASLFQATTDSAVIAWTDLVVNRELSTFQYGHHLLVLGLLVWASSQFASYAAFGHRRPLNAVAAIGLLLLANMSLTLRDSAAVHRPVLGLGALPARPLPHVRRAVRLGAPPDRRPIRDLRALPPGRFDLHRDGGRGIAAADQCRRLGAPRGGLDGHGRPPARMVAGHRAVPAVIRLRPLDRALVRAERATSPGHG